MDQEILDLGLPLGGSVRCGLLWYLLGSFVLLVFCHPVCFFSVFLGLRASSLDLLEAGEQIKPSWCWVEMKEERKDRMRLKSAIGLLVGVIMIGTWLQASVAVWAESNQPSQVNQLNVGSYFPFAVGNRWMYEANKDSSTEEWKVTREENDAFVVQVTVDSLSAASFEEFFRPSADGIERMASPNRDTKEQKHPVVNSKLQAQLDNEPQADTGPLFLLKGPLQIGTVWENNDGRYEITALNETVTVPAGTFQNCIEVMRWSKGGNVTVTSLYAPGVGVVQRDETFPLLEGSGNLNARQRQQMVLQLKEWQIK